MGPVSSASGTGSPRLPSWNLGVKMYLTTCQLDSCNVGFPRLGVELHLMKGSRICG